MLAVRSIPIPVNALVRQFSSNLPSAAADVKRTGKSRTRKKREDLPETLLSLSGEPLAPLAAWEGGLKGLPKRCKSFSKAGQLQPLTPKF
jgi:hypothetical protein